MTTAQSQVDVLRAALERIEAEWDASWTVQKIARAALDEAAALAAEVSAELSPWTSDGVHPDWRKCRMYPKHATPAAEPQGGAREPVAGDVWRWEEDDCDYTFVSKDDQWGKMWFTDEAGKRCFFDRREFRLAMTFVRSPAPDPKPTVCGKDWYGYENTAERCQREPNHAGPCGTGTGTEGAR